MIDNAILGELADPVPSEGSSVKKVIFKNHQSPGDVLMLTAAVRDLHLSHPGKFMTDVDTYFPQLWEHNPYITKIGAHENAEIVPMNYPIINESNEGAYHFIHGFRMDMEEKLGIRIKATKFWGDIHLSTQERSWMSMIHQHFTGWDTPFWLICTGGKMDYTSKWWIPEYAQEVVDHFESRIQFVQFGAEGVNHVHPPLRGVINLVGKTDIRMFIRLMYHASGVICPITFAMHLAAAVPAKPGHPRRKACIVTAGGREPSNFTAYTNHVFLHANGQMKCCDNGGCWVSRTSIVGDGDEKDSRICTDQVDFKGRKVQRCMHDLVTSQDVIRAIEKYHQGGALQYLPAEAKSIQRNWDERKTK